VSEERVYTASGYFDKNMTTNHWIRSGSYFQSNRSGSETSDRNWLVVSATMKNMSSSVGMIIPNIWNVIKFMFQTTNQETSFFQLFVAPMLLLFFESVCILSTKLFFLRTQIMKPIDKDHDWPIWAVSLMKSPGIWYIYIYIYIFIYGQIVILTPLWPHWHHG